MTPSFTTFLIKSQLLANQELQGQGSFCEKSKAPEMFVSSEFWLKTICHGQLMIVDAHLSFMRIRCKLSCHQSYDPHVPGGDVVTMSRGLLMTGWNSQLWFSSTSMALLPGVILQQARMERKPLQQENINQHNHPSFQDIIKQRFAVYIRLERDMITCYTLFKYVHLT